MELDWKDFSDNGLTGMEAFVDDHFSIHIVKYDQGEGYHWVAREWDDNDECTVTGSYDFSESQYGWDYLSDAYKSAMDYMADIGVISFDEADELQQPSRIRKFLDKAVRFGLASMISLTTLIGAGAPALAYADETSPDPSDVYIELQDGVASITLPELADLSNEVYLTGEDNNLVEVSPGSRLYDYVMDQIAAGCPDAETDFVAYIGKVDGGSPLSLSVPEQIVKYHGRSAVLDESARNHFKEEFKFTNSALAGMYHMHLDDDQIHPARIMSFDIDGDLATEIGLCEHVEMPDEATWDDATIAAGLGYEEGEYFDYDEYWSSQEQAQDEASFLEVLDECIPFPMKIVMGGLVTILVISLGAYLYLQILLHRPEKPRYYHGGGRCDSYWPD